MPTLEWVGGAALWQYQVKTQPVFVPTPPFPSYFQPWSLPVRQRFITTALRAPNSAWSTFTPSEIITVDKWFARLSEPKVKTLARLRDGAQQAFTTSPLPLTPSMDWYDWFAEPVRTKARLRDALQQPYTTSPLPFTPSMDWDQPFAEPVRVKPRLRDAAQQFLAFDPAVSPFVATGWYNWLSEPVRTKPGLRSALQQFLIRDTFPIPTPVVIALDWYQEWQRPAKMNKPGLAAADQQALAFWPFPLPPPFFAIQWYANLAEPVRLKPGVRAGLQQFLAWPPRIVVTSSIFAVMHATESGDTMRASAVDYNQPQRAKVGLVEEVFMPKTGLIEK